MQQQQQRPLFDGLITFIIIIKLIFLGLAIYDKLLLEKTKMVKTPSQKTKVQDKEKNVSYWKGRVEFIFVILMSIVLIYLFYPRSKNPPVIDGHTRLLLFLYGILSILTADWEMFFNTSVIWSTLSRYLFQK